MELRPRVAGGLVSATLPGVPEVGLHGTGLHGTGLHGTGKILFRLRVG